VKPVAALVATAVLLLAGLIGPLGGTGAAAAAEPAVDRVSGVSLRLDLTDMSPRIVTATGPDTLTIIGTLTNTGDQPVEQLRARVQRGNPITTEGALRDALEGNAAADAVTPQFQPIADELAPGESIPFRLSVPLRGSPAEGLALGQTGVHEILVNVNGVPTRGQLARVAAVRMLLPVHSLPPDGRSAGVSPRSTGSAVPFSMLYPISDRPHRLATVPGQKTLLADDALAASFASGGRLHGLVTAVAQEAPAGSPVRAATCLAIDPALVETAAAMRDGYEVLQPDGSAAAGTGADAAGKWLDMLASVAKAGCTVALPYADADLVALTRGGLGAVATQTIRDARDLLTDQELLGLSALPPVTWPADGAVDEPTLAPIVEAGDQALILSADAVEQGRLRRSRGMVTIAGSPLYALLSDPLLTAAGQASTRQVSGVAIGGAAATTTPSGTSTPLSTQDTIGALAFRAAEADRAAASGDPMVLAPPREWGVEGTGARALLSAVSELISRGELTPRNPVDVLRSGPDQDAPQRALVYPTPVGAREIPGAVVEQVRRTGAALADLVTAAEEPDPGTVGVGPEQAFTPVRRGLVRPLSAALRGSPGAAETFAGLQDDRVEALRGLVAVVEPTIPFSLGTSDAPLPITIVNGLPVPVRVRIEVSPTPGLQVAPIAEQSIPPLGRRQLSVNAKVTRSGQFTVVTRVITPGGGQLGAASRLKVVSTAYGTITVWLTATAGALLVLLVARRVLRRRRGGPDHPPGPGLPPDLPPGPPPDPVQDRDPDPGPPPDQSPDRLPGPLGSGGPARGRDVRPDPSRTPIPGR